MASFVVIVADTEGELSQKIKEYIEKYPGRYSAGKIWETRGRREGKPVTVFMRFLRVMSLSKI